MDAEKLTIELINRGVQSTKIINLTKYMYEWKNKLISIYQINPDLMSLYISMKKQRVIRRMNCLQRACLIRIVV